MSGANLFWLFLGLSGGNFIYQLIKNKDYETAFERSFFQGVAILSIYIFSKI